MTETGLDVTDCDHDRSHGSPFFEKKECLWPNWFNQRMHLKNSFKINPKTLKMIKIWQSYKMFTKFTTAMLKFHENFHKYINSLPKLTFIGSY